MITWPIFVGLILAIFTAYISIVNDEKRRKKEKLKEIDRQNKEERMKKLNRRNY